MAVKEMTLQEYADHRGCTKGAVSQKMGSVLSTASVRVFYEGKQKRVMINPVQADLEWMRNSPGAPKSSPATLPKCVQGSFKKGDKEALEIVARVSGAPRANAAKPKPKVQSPGPDGSPEPPEMSKEAKELLDIGMRKKRAEVEKLEADALRSRIETEKAARLLVDADEFEELFSGIAADFRDALLVIRESVKADFPELDHKLHDYLDAKHREALLILAIPERERVDVESRISVVENSDAE